MDSTRHTETGMVRVGFLPKADPVLFTHFRATFIQIVLQVLIVRDKPQFYYLTYHYNYINIIDVTHALSF